MKNMFLIALNGIAFQTRPLMALKDRKSDKEWGMYMGGLLIIIAFAMWGLAQQGETRWYVWAYDIAAFGVTLREFIIFCRYYLPTLKR